MGGGAGAGAGALREAVAERGDFRFGPASLQISWADRVAVTGPNGAGKSTLIDVLLGRVPLVSGSASLGSGIMVGQVDQARSQFRGRQSLLDAFTSQVPDLLPADSRTLLAKFGLKSDHVTRPADSLSPGERTRAGRGPRRARGGTQGLIDEPPPPPAVTPPGPAAGQGGQPADTRRADQPPGYPRHRAARVRPGRLPGHVPAGDP